VQGHSRPNEPSCPGDQHRHWLSMRRTRRII
jgi:hypothetical protein